MPKLILDSAEQNMTQQSLGGSTFQFSAAKIDSLGSPEYTLVAISIDMTGSIAGFVPELTNCLKNIVQACKKSPRAANLMLRVTTFNTYKGIQELHGFTPVENIDPDQYTLGNASGGTNLFDAAYDGLGSIFQYSEQLMNRDFDVNGISFVLTDGMDTSSKMSPKMIADLLTKTRKDETVIESILTVLVGVGVNSSVQRELKNFEQNAKFDQFVPISNASTEEIAKLAQFVSKSISSQSQSLGTGGPSKTLTF